MQEQTVDRVTRIGSAVVTPTLKDTYLASRRLDLAEVATIARALPKKAKVYGVLLSHEFGLMQPRGKLRVALWFVSIRGALGRKVFMQQMLQRDEAGTLHMWEQTLQHMLRGKDTEDTDSVGGWSQRELDVFTKRILPVLLA